MLPFCLNAQTGAAIVNPWEWLGQLHNTSLARYHMMRGEQRDTSTVQVLEEVSRVMATEYPGAASNRFTRRAPELLARIDAMSIEQLYAALHLQPAQQTYVNHLLHMPDNLSPAQAKAYVQATETRILTDAQLSPQERNIPLACAAIARNSADYWADYYLLDDMPYYTPERDTIILGDTLRLDRKGRPVPPFGRVLKADFFGLLKGLVGGTVIWVVSELPKVDFAMGPQVAIAFAVVLPVAESAVYNWKFRRGKVKLPEHDEPMDEWEIYQN
ncbi:MAG: hypothetical protein KF690_03380 [Bacteroidetes bacterium]|nr:hypothetical protein [Bacteroidota bacterium]